MLAGRGELTQLPERLRQPVFCLGVLAQLEQLAVRLGRVGPLGRGRLGNRLVGELALQPRLVDGAAGGRIDVGEGHGKQSFRASRARNTGRSGRGDRARFLAPAPRFVKRRVSQRATAPLERPEDQ